MSSFSVSFTVSMAVIGEKHSEKYLNIPFNWTQYYKKNDLCYQILILWLLFEVQNYVYC